MISYEEKQTAKSEAEKACQTSKEIEQIKISKGFRYMKLGRDTILTSPAKQAERLKQGYKFI